MRRWTGGAGVTRRVDIEQIHAAAGFDLRERDADGCGAECRGQDCFSHVYIERYFSAKFPQHPR
jgi:hypothetical protein